jgi:ribosomal protein S18 acetylase RimI-like enzyme
MSYIEIIKLSITDLNILQKVGIQTFSESYTFNNNKDSMSAYMKDGFSIKKLQSELLDPNSEFYFAYINNDLAGYLKINIGSSQTEIKSDKGLEIQRIYLLKDFYGKKIGQLLLDKTIAIARQKNLDYIWLSVWEENPKAIKFYEKNGFIEFDKHIFTLGTEEQTDIMMKLKL